MERLQLFTKAQQTLNQLIFAIKLNIPANPLSEDEIKALKRILLISHKHEFGRSDYIYDPHISGGTIIGNHNYRNVVITPSLIQYAEKRNFNNANFNDVCKQLYDFYITKRQVDLLDIKVIGKVFNFAFQMEQNSLDLLKSRTNLFRDKHLSSLSLKATILEEEKNIHIHIHNQDGLEDTENNENILFITLDFNNHDQVSGVIESSFHEIMRFADDFVKNRLLHTLNQSLGESET